MALGPIKRPARRAKAERAPTTADPIEIAMEAQAGGLPAAGPAHDLLVAHGRLVRLQIASERVGLGLRLLTGAAGLAAAVAVGTFVWSASQVGVVVQPFDTPPAMASRGLTGPVVAAQVLDRLRAMQAETVTLRADATLSSGWGDVSLEIANTGLSLSEIRRVLVGWLGDETRVSGEVFETPDGQLALSTRVGAQAGETVRAAPAAFDTLLAQAAESVYRRTQPYLYAQWLVVRGRAPESVALLRTLAAGPDRTERLWALYSLSYHTPVPEEQRRYAQAALRLDPRFTPAIYRLTGVEARTGDAEAQLAAWRRLRAVADLFRKQVRRENAEAQLAISAAAEAGLLMDWVRAADEARRVGDTQTDGLNGRTGFVTRGASMFMIYTARHLVLAHDLPGARAALDEGALGSATLNGLTERWLDARRWYAASVGDWARAADDLSPIAADNLGENVRATVVAVMARAGRFAEAEAAMVGFPPGSYLAGSARGLIAAYSGRPAVEVDAAFRDDVRRGPSLPTAHGYWAEALLLRGDAAGALSEANLAHKLGPRWPDALRLRGEALLKLGRAREAEAAFRDAIDLAPRWGGLRLVHGDALAALDKVEAARAAWRAAAGMDLSATDRARVTALLQKRTT